MKKIIYLAALVAILTVTNNCTKSSPSDGNSNPGADEVWIEGMAFSPKTKTVTAGTTITWTNKDGVTHNVTSDTGLFSSGPMSNGETFSYTFATAGTFSYKCTIHPSMTASVTVN